MRHPPESLKRSDRSAFVDRMNAARRAMKDAEDDLTYCLPRNEEAFRADFDAAKAKFLKRQGELNAYDESQRKGASL